ncbi:MAG TPA: cation acetate symporter [Thiobacillus sp.]|nr:MAG: cation acetate symporter [Hydrogenophilales bacterium 28-61-11]OYZ58217.1 MAG: cation acetate symporter [Hydrogenophilales bacterium 16-61-112]OZA44707.1 MAG: cation acetate symporter [Hydrogenophilales bacterium 17-61-76]HQT31837.1 cation acetate symporter [Thiobacillus sp.]HQT71335.1 cation acetate symporter [Thiobacillus sp.]
MERHTPLFMGTAALLASGLACAGAGAVADEYKWMTFAVFGAIIAITMYITFWAAKQTHTTSEFYAAGRSVTGIQNGWAIAGDYLSAASFLGIAGLISLYGYDGFMYSVGWLVAYITVLLVIAEPCRNIGKYTLGDILAFRNHPKASKTVAALSTITVSTFYLTAQMVGGGVLIKTLIGIDYYVSVIGVGVLMLAYVVFGGMKATTWVQIIKAVLLVTASILLVLITWSQYGFSLPGFLNAVVSDPKVQAQVAKLVGDAATTMTPQELGQRFLEPGLFLKSPIDQISLGMALVLGTAGMPHILMRFFTVPTAQAARTSVLWAMGIIGGFYMLTLFLGMGAAINVGSSVISNMDPGGNMAAPLLAQYAGGGADSVLGNLFLAFVAAVAFATIVAVVAGLVLAAASAMAHDIYVGVIKGDHASPQEQVIAARVSSVIVGILAIIVGIAAEGQNVAHLVALAFAVAASSNLPAVFLTLYWKRANTYGIVLGMLVGAITAITLVLVSPNMTYPKTAIKDANKVLQGEPAQAAKPAAAAVSASSFACELFALEGCVKSGPAKPASPEKPAKPGAPEKLATLQATLPTLTDIGEIEAAQKDIAKLEKDIKKAEDTLKKMEGQTTSMAGLEEPFFLLKNPGLISIPLGFLMVVLGSLLFRDKRAEDMWEELYVRQNTGINAEGASAH